MSSSAPTGPLLILLALAASMVAFAATACSESSSSPAPANVVPNAPDAASVDDADEDAADGAVACQPRTVEGSTTTFHPAASAYRGKCTRAQIDELITVCVLSPDATKCASAKATASACSACVFGTVDSNPATPLIEGSGLQQRNLGACIGLLTGDVSDTSCAFKVAKVQQCNFAACSAGVVCPNSKSSDYDDGYQSCRDVVDSSERYCKASADEAEACLIRTSPVITDVCFPKDQGNDAIFRAMGDYSELFCGTAPDGGG